MATVETNYGTGRRKTSSARVFLKSRVAATSPSMAARWMSTSVAKPTRWLFVNRWSWWKRLTSLTCWLPLAGGGNNGQAGAIRHGITRALMEYDGELRGQLRRAGYVTRDAREVERKKVGLRKARRRPQFSKR